MKTYIGTKIIKAHPMTREDAEKHLGRDVGGTKHGDGYLVEYSEGYQSWSPKNVFDAAYHLCTAMSFGMAIEALKIGKKVTRAGWNGKNMFLFLVPGSTFKVNRPPLLGIYPEDTEINYRPHIDLKGVDGSISTWNPTCNDVLAEDWEIVQ